MLAYEHLLNPRDIWNIRQNKPHYVAQDLEQYGVPRDVTYKVLVARGVFKWLSVRRDLIKLKNVWKARLSEAYRLQHEEQRTEYRKGYIAAYEEARREVRALCHSERWRAPDFDSEAQAFLKEMEDAV
jgi:hypothetical protein